jgi:hypothetical protein
MLGGDWTDGTMTLASITERDRAVLGKEQLLLIIGLPNMVDIILQFSLRVYGDATWRRMFGLLNY